jgi:glucosamine kinase
MSSTESNSLAANQTFIGLGLDAGGTKTRVALTSLSSNGAGAVNTETILLDDAVASISGLMLATESGSARLRETLASISTLLHERNLPMPHALVAGLTGYDTADERATQTLTQMFRAAFGNTTLCVALENDVQCAYHGYFRPGAGYLVYAGTGSIAVFIDSDQTAHRVGGRSGLIGDEGSAFWIAKTALNAIWRIEDETPGAWRNSAMATRIFELLGSSDWTAMRALLGRNERGEIALLARAVGETGNVDPAAQRILTDAGSELARLANIMVKRFGNRPIALAGGTLKLHPLITETFRATLDASVEIVNREANVQVGAAKRAARLAAALR